MPAFDVRTRRRPAAAEKAWLKRAGRCRSISRMLVCLAILVWEGCDGGEHASRSASARPAEDLLRPYPPGNWRLAPNELHKTILTASMIHIAHAKASLASGQSGDDAPDERPSTTAGSQRTREQARALALSVAQRAREAPAQFASLAHAHSDDIVSATRGGSLGSLHATAISPAFLDALSTMRPGETSRVIETEQGFYILQLQPTQAETKVAARRVVIGYAGAEPAFRRTDAPVERSRAQAELLAKRVAVEALANPERFSDLVARYSDHADALRDGDFGVWSSYEATNRREFEALSALQVGGVSEPIDGTEGFSVFLRTPVTERTVLATTYLRIHDGDPGAPAAKFAELRDVLRGSVEDFDRLQAKYCCDTVMQWPQGRGNPKIERLISALPIGAAATTPLDHGLGFFHLYKRVAPRPRHTDERLTDVLPKPRTPDVDSLVHSIENGEVISKYIAALKQSLGESLGVDLDDRRRREVSSVFDQLAEQIRTSAPEQRGLVLRAARERLKAVLNEDEYASIKANLRSELTRRLLGGH